jgi:histidinol-phosphate aminotransferase
MAPEALERQLGHPFHLRLGANESNFGMSPRAIEALRKSVENMGRYGDPECHDLREALATKHGVTSQNILVSTGLDDVLSLCARAFVNPGDAVINSLGGYPTFNYGAQGAGAKIETTPYVNDQVDLAGLSEAAHRTAAKVVFLANPDNPSGSWHSARKVLDFLETLPKSCILLLDEAYSDFAPEDALPEIDVEDPRVIRLRTFSKAHGLAGARVGYMIASNETVAAVNKIRMHFGVGLAAQVAALASLQDPGFLADVVNQAATGREDYHRLGRELGVPTLPSSTNFVAFDLKSRDTADAALNALLARGVFIRKPGHPPLSRCIRVTVGRKDERAEFADHLAAVLSSPFLVAK